MAERKIEVTGIRELRRALKEAEGRSVKELQQANKDAAEIVANAARIRAPKGKHEGGGKIQTIVASIKAQATSGRGVVAFGGVRAPHAPVYEFGGSIPRRGARSTHGAVIKKAQAGHRSFEKAGIPVTKVDQRAYVYPAIHAERERVLREYEQALARIAKHL